MDPCCVSNDKSVLWLGDGIGKVSMFLTLLIVVHFCNREDPAKLVIFESVNGLQGDCTIEACQFIMEGDQRVVGSLLLEDAIFVPYQFPCCWHVLVVKRLARE